MVITMVVVKGMITANRNIVKSMDTRTVAVMRCRPNPTEATSSDLRHPLLHPMVCTLLIPATAQGRVAQLQMPRPLIRLWRSLPPLCTTSACSLPPHMVEISSTVANDTMPVIVERSVSVTPSSTTYPTDTTWWRVHQAYRSQSNPSLHRRGATSARTYPYYRVGLW